MKLSFLNLLLTFLLVVSIILNLYLASQLVMLNQKVSELNRALSENTVVANLVINFGNGTRKWYNNTLLPFGSSLLNLTLKATNGNVEYSIGKYGAFVMGISNVGTKFTKKNYYWLWYKWNSTSKSWELGATSADNYKVMNGDILGWVYANVSSWPPTEKP